MRSCRGDDRGKQRSGHGEGAHAGQRFGQVQQGGVGPAAAPAPLQVPENVQLDRIHHCAAQEGQGKKSEVCSEVSEVPVMMMLVFLH